MLLLTLLPMVGWATDVAVGGGYTASIAEGQAFNNGTPYVLQGKGLPVVTGFSVAGNPLGAPANTFVPALDDATKYEVYQKDHNDDLVKVGKNNGEGDDALPLGNYFLKFQIVNANQVTVVYVPFQVYGDGSNNFDYVHDFDSFTDANLPGHGLFQYYEANPWSDWGEVVNGAVSKIYQPTGQPWWSANTTKEARLAWWNGENDTDPTMTNGEAELAAFSNDADRNFLTAVAHPKVDSNSNPDGLPWIVPFGFENFQEGVRLLFWYNKGNNTNSTVYPWNTGLFGGQDLKKWGVASVANVFGEDDWDYGQNPNKQTDFDIDNFRMYLVPATDIAAGDIPAPESVERRDISVLNAIAVNTPDFVFNGQVQKPLFTAVADDPSTTDVDESAAQNSTVTWNSDNAVMVEGRDFTVTFSGNDFTNAGEKAYTITGIGLYKGTANGKYTINPFELGPDNFSLDTDAVPAEFPYDGTDKNPGVVGRALLIDEGSPVDQDFTELTSGTDFDVVLKKGTEEVSTANLVGNYTLTVNPKGNYKKAATADIVFEFSVTPIDLSEFKVQVNDGDDFVYNTKEQKPVFEGADANVIVAANIPEPGQAGLPQPLTYGEDYTVEYVEGGDYTNVGEKIFTIKAKEGSGYTGQFEASYNIVAKDIADADVIKKFTEPKYTGEDFNLTQENFDFNYNDDKPLQLADDPEHPEIGDFTWELDYTGIPEEEREEYATTAGDKNIIVTGQGNYTGTWNGTVKMKQFVITITTADANKIYGDADPRPNFTVDANSSAQVPLYGEEWYYIQSFLKMERYNNQTNEESIKENVGGHDYIIVWDPEKNPDDCNYKVVIQNNTGILKIDAAPLTVTIAQSTKVYSGDPATDPDFTADKGDQKFKITKPNPTEGAEPIDVTDSKDFADETKNLKDVLNIGRKPGEDVKDSPYEFTWDNPNYAVTFEPVGFTITPKQVQLDIVFNEEGYEYIGKNVDPVPTVKIKGTDTELTYEKDFNVVWNDGENGNTRRDVTVGNNQNGNRWPWATISQVEKGNYTFVTADYKYYKITPATLKIAALSDNSKVYNTSDPTPLSQVTFAEGFGPKGTDYWRYNEETGALESNFTFTPALLTRETGESVGNYEISVNPAAKTRNYTVVSTAKANFHIYRSEDTFVISFDPDPKYITYGDEIDLTTLVTVTAPTGYNGNLTADLLKYAKENVKKYQLIDPETGEIDENGEKTYIETSNAGTYKLTIDDYPTAFSGYSVFVDEGVLTINPFPLYIRSCGSKEYGSEDPELAWDVYEKKVVNNVETYVLTDKTDYEVYEEDMIGNSDNWFENRYRYTISRATGEDVDKYTTTIRPYRYRRSGGTRTYGTRTVGNYSFQFAEGEFEITRRDLAVTVTGASKFYGEIDPAKRIFDGRPAAKWLEPRTEEEEEDNIEMFANGLVKIKIENALAEDAQDIANKVIYKDRATGETANNYQVFQVTFDGVTNPGKTRIPNYNLTFVADNVQFQIEKRVLKVTAHDQSVQYANPIVVDPYDLTITDGIIEEGQYLPSLDVNYDSDVTILSKDNTTDSKAINDKVTDVFKPLEVAEGKTAVGVFHKDAFSLELTDEAKKNYVLEFTNGKLYLEQMNDLYLDMANLAQALNDHQGRTVTVHMVGAPNKEEGCDPFRQFVAYQWNTFVLPFSAMPREIVAPFRYGAIDILDEANTNEGSFRLGLTTRRVAANQPFLIQTDKNMKYADMQNVKWENVQIAEFDYVNQDPTSEDAAGNKFVGTYKPKSDFTDANYIMRANTGEFFRFIAGEGQEAPSYAMKQTEAYLEAVNPAAGVRIFIDEEDGSTTAIDFVEGETKTINAEGAFNLSGQRVSKAQKGILIIDGKKVLVK